MTTEKASNEIKYNYFIYILTCLALTTGGIYIVGSDPNSEINYPSIVFKISLIFVFASLLWIVGKRFNLKYIWMCLIGGLGLALPNLIKEFRSSSALNFLESLPSWIFTIFIVAIVILVLSYPLQFVFSRFRTAITKS